MRTFVIIFLCIISGSSVYGSLKQTKKILKSQKMEKNREAARARRAFIKAQLQQANTAVVTFTQDQYELHNEIESRLAELTDLRKSGVLMTKRDYNRVGSRISYYKKKLAMIRAGVNTYNNKKLWKYTKEDVSFAAPHDLLSFCAIAHEQIKQPSPLLPENEQ